MESCGLTSAVSTLSSDILTPPLAYTGQLKALWRTRSSCWNQRQPKSGLCLAYCIETTLLLGQGSGKGGCLSWSLRHYMPRVIRDVICYRTHAFSPSHLGHSTQVQLLSLHWPLTLSPFYTCLFWLRLWVCISWSWTLSSEWLCILWPVSLLPLRVCFLPGSPSP